MHDIGRIALAVIQPKEYANLLGTHRGTPSSILEGERKLFGWDHCETGRQLIADWKLPADFDAIVLEHHCAKREDGAWGMAELVKIKLQDGGRGGVSGVPWVRGDPVCRVA